MCDRPHTVKVICSDANTGILNQSVAELFRRQACTLDIEEDHIGFYSVLDRDTRCVAK